MTPPPLAPWRQVWWRWLLIVAFAVPMLPFLALWAGLQQVPSIWTFAWARFRYDMHSVGLVLREIRQPGIRRYEWLQHHCPTPVNLQDPEQKP